MECVLIRCLACLFASSALAQDFTVVARLPSPDGEVRVVDLPTEPPIRFLLSGRSTIGARFLGDEFAGATPFVNFAIHRAAAHLVPRPTSMLQLGLGAGTVPSYFEDSGIKADVVELSPQVADCAKNYFDFNSSGFMHGRLHITDARSFLFAEEGSKAYSVVVHDLFTGYNPWSLLTFEVFKRIQEAWLLPRGVLVVNIVGWSTYSSDDNDIREAVGLTWGLLDTLRAVFRYARAFREMPSSQWQDQPTNLVYFASDSNFHFDLPVSPHEAPEPPEMSPEWVMGHFQEWEQVRSRDPSQDDVTTNITDASFSTLCSRGQEAVRDAMWQRANQELPQGVWEEGHHEL